MPYQYYISTTRIVTLIQGNGGLCDDAKIEIAGAATQMMLLHSAEDIIKTTEELTRLGFNHIIFGNMTTLPDERASLKVFEDVLPHVV